LSFFFLTFNVYFQLSFSG